MQQRVMINWWRRKKEAQWPREGRGRSQLPHGGLRRRERVMLGRVMGRGGLASL